MKVLNINKFFYLKGGAERYYFSLARLLEKNGIEVIPFSMQDSKNFPSEYSKYFVPNLNLSKPGLKMITKAPGFIWSHQAQIHLEELIKKTKPDVAHIHNIYHQISPSILKTLKQFKIPVVMTVHDYKIVCPNYSLYTQGSTCTRCKGHKYYNAVLHKCLKNSYAFSALGAVEMSIHKLMKVYENNIDRFIVPSEFVAQTLIDFGQNPDKITVLPHFINPDFLGHEVKEPKEQYMLYFGRLNTEKGIDKLLNFMYIYKPHLPLKVAGSGPLEKWAQAYIKDRGIEDQVELLGHLKTEELIKTIKEASVVLIPSRVWETFGLAALESIALGTPVVAYRSGALPEIITPEVGRVVQFDNEHDMLNAIEEVITWKKQDVKNAAAKLIKEKYNPEMHFNKLKEIYLSLK